MPLCTLTLEEELVELIERYQLSYITSLGHRKPLVEEDFGRFGDKMQAQAELSHTEVIRKSFPVKILKLMEDVREGL